MLRIFLSILFLLLPNLSFAVAKNWQFGFQEAASLAMEKLTHFHNLLLVIITGVVIFVFALLTYTCIRFYHKNNPVC